jgi:hypothetical protein
MTWRQTASAGLLINVAISTALQHAELRTYMARKLAQEDRPALLAALREFSHDVVTELRIEPTRRKREARGARG